MRGDSDCSELSLLTVGDWYTSEACMPNTIVVGSPHTPEHSLPPRTSLQSPLLGLLGEHLPGTPPHPASVRAWHQRTEEPAVAPWPSRGQAVGSRPGSTEATPASKRTVHAGKYRLWSPRNGGSSSLPLLLNGCGQPPVPSHGGLIFSSKSKVT